MGKTKLTGPLGRRSRVRAQAANPGTHAEDVPKAGEVFVYRIRTTLDARTTRAYRDALASRIAAVHCGSRTLREKVRARDPAHREGPGAAARAAA